MGEAQSALLKWIYSIFNLKIILIVYIGLQKISIVCVYEIIIFVVLARGDLMSNIANIIGERIRSYRLQAGYTQEILAEKAELHNTYIGQIERGEKNATLESIEKIAKALKLPLEKLFEGIIIGETGSPMAMQCYNLVQSQPAKNQEKLYEIIKQIIEYR